MIKFIIRRLIISLPQVILLSILVFFIGSLMPGDALSGLIDPTIPVEQIERLREQMGLNDPWYIQYKDWVVAMLQGDFGHSFFKQQPVLDVIGDRMLNTVWLGLFSTVLIYLIGLPLGLISGRWNDSLLDSAITGYTYLGFATPTFIFGLVMLLVFGYTLGWLPTGGSVGVGVTPGTLEYVISKFQHLVLPSFSIALIGLVGTVQYLRSGIIETKQKDFVTLARAKGVSEGKVYTKHIFRNSILPIAAFFGYEITSLLGGSLFIETIYGYPGMGRLFLESISIRDFSVANVLILVFGMLSILGALLSDIILSIVDPRIRIK
ncbi:ABC transporter permease [Jeotgalicoccus meleagridis]|jgi:ABC-type dipeptide/oligopeptide/nickel transport system permease component|uniref:Glutathione transport system permease protein GsiC n=1 Tax=Jeotgalicoccus meleagridis TaxID=2759181 RepID=A0A6V7RN86_9STAP|nr:ABC transporter permease [Jeotgalicoccus meleagridis]CAD2079908.1 Glutathione transport system permease protein GsiC [Jeotgalicoccus meleagridis]HIW37427.1 ABC transporter permease [Candidatus Jeotgalicoccus stercoravium]